MTFLPILTPVAEEIKDTYKEKTELLGFGTLFIFSLTKIFLPTAINSPLKNSDLQVQLVGI